MHPVQLGEQAGLLCTKFGDLKDHGRGPTELILPRWKNHFLPPLSQHMDFGSLPACCQPPRHFSSSVSLLKVGALNLIYSSSSQNRIYFPLHFPEHLTSIHAARSPCCFPLYFEMKPLETKDV